jgi:proto-oncogene serine/threonine-protein kinase mos
MGMIVDPDTPGIPFTWSLDINEVDIVCLLGSGGFGSVYEAKYKNSKVALKQLHTNTKNKKAAMQSFKAETRHEVLALDHPNIVKTLGVSTASSLDDKPCFIMEYISTKTLQHILHDPDEMFDDSRRIHLADQISKAMVFIHKNGIVHLDLKPVNVLMTNDGVCKIADFGCCQYIEDHPNTPSRSYLTGTFAYRAPELLKGEDPTYKADVFSFAILLWQLWSREIPYKLQNHQVVIFRVVACNLRPPIPTGCDIDNRYVDLMTSAWAGNPHDRPSMEDVSNTLGNWRF